MKVAVVLIGALLEWFGVFLIASPELVPRWRRARAALGRATDSLRGWLRRLLRRRRVVTGSSEVSARGGASAKGYVVRGRPDDPSLEARVAWLLEEHERTQERLGVVENVLHELPEEWRRDIERAKGEMEATAVQKVEEAQGAYINRRLTGVVLVLLGVPLLAWANFLD
jgi:hypothetical protein